MSGKIITRRAAAQLVKNGDTLAVGGFNGYGVPEELLVGLRERFLETGAPRGLTIFHSAACGDRGERGANRIALEGLVQKLYCGHIGLEPHFARLTAENKIATYLVPQGVSSHLLRAIAGKKVGVVTHVGLKTYADPRLEGCKLNAQARAAGDVVELVTLAGREQLLYYSFPLHVGFIRASYADEDGNLTLEKEACFSEQLEIAAAVHNSGGLVVAHVEKVVARHTLHPHLVKIHGFMVDYIVEGSPEHTFQSYTTGTGYRPEWIGEVRIPLSALAPAPLSERKVIGRRGAMELKAGMLVNLGLGIPDQVAAVVAEEGISEAVTLSIESGILGGVALSGLDLGGAVNPVAVYKEPDIFDIYDGGGIDLTCLGAAQIDARGNVNVSRFSDRVVGPGGFINISQNAKKVCFCGTFLAGRQSYDIRAGKLKILQNGTGRKFVRTLDQVTFSGDYSRETGQEVLYLTERAVFGITGKGLTLEEVAPGVEPETDIFPFMDFRPHVSDRLKQMDPRIFRDGKMGLCL
ncbi:MAG: 3-oxoacid CoA-transferase [Deltaproteobacteria bacterium]|jgi:propionate CoA-transferase|nr:3-oxoacid CoA-transferase [Deltaproteobacteria bacterium]